MTLTRHRDVVVFCHCYHLYRCLGLSLYLLEILGFIPKERTAGRPAHVRVLPVPKPSTSCLNGTQATSTAAGGVLGPLFNAPLCCLDLLSSFFLQHRHLFKNKQSAVRDFTSRTNSAWRLEGKTMELRNRVQR